MLKLNLGDEQGVHVKLASRPDIVARLSHEDVNVPNFDGFPLKRWVPEVKFEAAVYELLRPEPGIPASRLIYHRAPVEQVGPKSSVPENITGRHLFLFEREEGENNVWKALSPEQRVRASVSNLFLLKLS